MQHLVLFKFDPLRLKEEFGDLNKLQECFDELKSYIPGVGYIEIKAKNPSPYGGYQDGSGGWSHFLLSTHISADDLKVYAEHPQHKALQARMAKCMLAPPMRVEMDDPKQAGSDAPLSSGGPGIQHVVLFTFDHQRLKDYGGLALMQSRFNALQAKLSGPGYIELKAKNPEPWPRYQDGSNGVTHVLISTHATNDLLQEYADHEEHKALQVGMKKCLMSPPLRIDGNFLERKSAL